jgi:hypothetical protein
MAYTYGNDSKGLANYIKANLGTKHPSELGPIFNEAIQRFQDATEYQSAVSAYNAGIQALTPPGSLTVSGLTPDQS